MVQPQRLYTPHSIKVKLNDLNLRPNSATLIFTADAESMYTNIDTNIALELLDKYLSRYNFGLVPHDVIMAVLTIIMRNNLFAFGNIFWLQLIGTAMGTLPVPDYASLLFAVKEDKLFTSLPQLEYYHCYIDGIFTTWQPLPTPSPSEDYEQWLAFKAEFNDFYGLK